MASYVLTNYHVLSTNYLSFSRNFYLYFFQAENSCRVTERHGHRLLTCLVGDSLLEPFWPTGTGCPRGFIGGFDACWLIRTLALGKVSLLEAIAERESIYRLLVRNLEKIVEMVKSILRKILHTKRIVLPDPNVLIYFAHFLFLIGSNYS